MKAQRQEEKASQKASKETAKALLKLEKERLKTERGGSRTPSLDRSGSRPLLMKRQGPSPLQHMHVLRKEAVLTVEISDGPASMTTAVVQGLPALRW